MALPSKVVDQLSRTPARTPGWSSRVLLFSATFCILALVIFLGIEFGYKPYVNGQITSAQARIDEFSKQVEPEQQAELISFYSQIENLTTLLKRQNQVSRIFQWLENHTNASVQLLSASFNAANTTVVVSGRARDIQVLGEQLSHYRQLVGKGEVADLQVSALALDPNLGGWNFTVSVKLTPALFAPAPVTYVPVEESIPESVSEVVETPASTSSASTTIEDVSTSSASTSQS